MPAPDWKSEVDELHQFFEDLYLSKLDSVERAATVFGPDKTFVGPDGKRIDRASVLAMLEAGIGHSTELTIEIEEHRTVLETDDVIIGEYVEVHRFATSEDGSPRGNRRRSTVVFDVDPSMPNGVRWRHVHETFITD